MTRVVTVHVVGEPSRSWSRRFALVLGVAAMLCLAGWAIAGQPDLAAFAVSRGGDGGWHPQTAGAALQDELAAGQEAGLTLLPCRAVIKGDIHLGRVRSDFTSCHVGFDGRETEITPYETLGLAWRSAGAAPFVAGEDNTLSQEAGLEAVALYPCRVTYHGGVHIGQVRAGERGCSFGFGGKRIQADGGEVLQAEPWLTWAHAAAHSLPDIAIAGGSEDGEAFYVCRAADRDGLHPGKVKRNSNGCSIISEGREALMDRFEVLVPRWVPARAGTAPVSAVLAGREAGRPQYLCRAQTRDGMELGKVNDGLGGCHIGMLGREVVAVEYEVLSQ